MDKQTIEASVLRVLTAVLKCPVNSDCNRENNPQWDSLKHIEVIFAIEDELNIQFSEDDLAKLNSVNRIVDCALALRHET